MFRNADTRNRLAPSGFKSGATARASSTDRLLRPQLPTSCCIAANRRSGPKPEMLRASKPVSSFIGRGPSEPLG